MTETCFVPPSFSELYAGIMDVPEYGVRGKRGVFEPLISDDLFYRAQAVLSGRLPSTIPKQRAQHEHVARPPADEMIRGASQHVDAGFGRMHDLRKVQEKLRRDSLGFCGTVTATSELLPDGLSIQGADSSCGSQGSARQDWH